MDNNFIKIDDLVRQHLEGAEENERAGAWLKMRDLLDEEMPRKKRVGIIYWKRIFGLVAAASLIGTMAVGSYELSSVYRRSAGNDPMSATSGKDFSRESGVGTMDVPPAWMGDEPATSGKINIRGAAHNPASTDAANTTTATEKPYNGGDNSNYMAAIASAANTNKNKADEAATRNVDNVVTNNTTTAAIAPNAGSNSNAASTSRLATTSAHQLPGHNTGMAMATTHPVPSTATGTNSTVYSNTQEQGSIRAKRNHKYSSNTNSNNSSSNNTQATVANDYNHNSNSSETATNSGSKQAITANNNNTGNNNNNRLATATNSSNSNNNNSGNNTSHWQGTAANSNSDSRIVPNNPVNNDANRNNSGKNYKNSKTQNANSKSIACTPVNNNNKGINRRKATADNGNNSINTVSNNTNNNEGLSGSVSARRNRRNGNAIPRIATTAGSPMPTTDARIADAGTHTLPTGTNSSNPATSNAATQKIGALNAAPSTGMHTGTTGHKPAATHTVPGTASSAPTTPGTNRKSGHTSNHIAGRTTANNNTNAGNNATMSRTTTTGTGESGSIKGHRNAKTIGNGHGVAKTIGSGSKPTQPATSVLASSAKVDKHTVTGKTPEAINDEVTDDQDTGEAAQKQEGDKKVITKIVLRQREVKNGNETHTQVDTVSMEKFSKQSEVPAEGNDPLSGNVTAKRGTNTPPPAAAAEPDTDTKPATAEKATGSKKHRKRHNAGEELAAAPSATTDAEDAPRTALADAPADNATAASANPSEVAAKKKSSERKSGASLLQKLSSAFNDVKQNATGAKFTPGITAGINSNFFGPSKMMGFQFGATGSFDFNETWSLMAELKYFNRINNNNIEDNYYSYTDMGNGQYRRELIRNTYDFAAMHTVELPLIIRYAKGNFNFYAGGNLQYAFSINTAPATTPDPTAQATFVSAPGTDNKPTYTEADFRSRFALGYIFGFSYQIAPNTSLDIRNVQSVWDNAATTGARSISNMLYRTPSVQLSIMYRLGGNKNKE